MAPTSAGTLHDVGGIDDDVVAEGTARERRAGDDVRAHGEAGALAGLDDPPATSTPNVSGNAGGSG